MNSCSVETLMEGGDLLLRLTFRKELSGLCGFPSFLKSIGTIGATRSFGLGPQPWQRRSRGEWIYLVL